MEIFGEFLFFFFCSFCSSMCWLLLGTAWWMCTNSNDHNSFKMTSMWTECDREIENDEKKRNENPRNTISLCASLKYLFVLLSLKSDKKKIERTMSINLIRAIRAFAWWQKRFSVYFGLNGSVLKGKLAWSDVEQHTTEIMAAMNMTKQMLCAWLIVPKWKWCLGIECSEGRVNKVNDSWLWNAFFCFAEYTNKSRWTIHISMIIISIFWNFPRYFSVSNYSESEYAKMLPAERMAMQQFYSPSINIQCYLIARPTNANVLKLRRSSLHRQIDCILLNENRSNHSGSIRSRPTIVWRTIS